jgi:hypothetical protein
MLELHCAETHNLCLTALRHVFKQPLVEQFQKVMHSACQVADSVPDDSSPNADAGMFVIPVFMDSIRIISSPEVTAFYD